MDIKARKKNNSSRKRLVNVDLQTWTPVELFIYASIYYYRSFMPRIYHLRDAITMHVP